jgi:hypothetical protein
LTAAFDDQRVVLIDDDALGAPRSSSSTFSSFRPSPRDELPAGDDGEVAHHRLAAIAEARRLDRAHLSTPRSLFTTRPPAPRLDISAMISSGLPRRDDLVQQRQQLGEVRNLLLVQQDVRVSEIASSVVGLVRKYGDR